MRTIRVRGFLAGALLAVSLPGGARADLPFIKDDYPKAVAQARAQGVPIFVEAWAPW